MHTGDSGLPILAMHKSGEALSLISGTNVSGKTTGITGSALRWQNGESLFVFLGSDGLPEKAVYKDLTIIYSNYSSDKVDFVIYEPNGEKYFEGNMPINNEYIQTLRSFHEDESSSQYFLKIRAISNRLKKQLLLLILCIFTGTLRKLKMVK